MTPDLAQFRARLTGRPARNSGAAWKSWATRPEFRACLEREFPVGASEWPEEGETTTSGGDGPTPLPHAGQVRPSRWRASRPASPRSREKIVPYVDQPEQIIPGKELLYATAMPLNGYGRGILVATDMGRPIKIEGNPAHPDSLGATDAITQAAILDLWDPGPLARLPFFNGQHLHLEEVRDPSCSTVLQDMQAKAQGDGMAILREPTTSPTMAPPDWTS